MDNSSNALGLVLIIVVSIVIAAAATLLFAFGFLPLLTASVVYINITSILLLALTLVFSFILYLRRNHYSSNIVFDLRTLIVLSVISVLLAAIAPAFNLAIIATASIILVFFATLFFAAALIVTIKLVFDFLNTRGSSCGCRD